MPHIRTEKQRVTQIYRLRTGEAEALPVMTERARFMANGTLDLNGESRWRRLARASASWCQVSTQ
jgi:hypothetical protein